MKHLLYILCLFVLSCDSGGDDAITMDDLNGDWWILSICKTYVGSGCIEDEEDTFIKLVKGITSKGFIRSNYKDKLVDLSNVRINLKSNK